MRDALPQVLLSYPRAAAAVDLTEEAFRTLVLRGRGPATVALGRRVMFRPCDLTAWVDSLVVPARPASTVAANPARRRRGRPTKAEQVARRAGGEG